MLCTGCFVVGCAIEKQSVKARPALIRETYRSQEKEVTESYAAEQKEGKARHKKEGKKSMKNK